MPFDVLKVLHIGSMFMATALAVGPSLVFYLVARSGDLPAIRRVFGYATPIGRVGAACYGFGIVFGAAAALTGSLDLTAHWLLLAYVLVGALAANGLLFERWSQRVTVAAALVADPGSRVAELARARTPAASLAVMIVLTIAIIFVMVAKPDLLP
jgi:hypothetical protein